LIKPDLGTKRVCPSCAARFYDLQKRPIECPKCAFSFEPEMLLKQRRTRVPEPVKAVVAEADDKGATIAAAYIALRPGNKAGDALANEIKEHAAKSLPRFKRPQRIHFMEALPRTATGKVQRFKLRQMSMENRGQAPIS